MPLTTLQRNLSMENSGKYIFTNTFSNVSIVRYRASLVTILVLDFTEFIDHLGKTQLFLVVYCSDQLAFESENLYYKKLVARAEFPLTYWSEQCQGRFNDSVADLGPPPPPGTQILSISCSFRENLAKWYVGAPPPREFLPPPPPRRKSRICRCD